MAKFCVLMMNSKKISAWSASWNRLFIKQSSSGLERKIQQQLLFHMEVIQRRRCLPDSTSKNKPKKRILFGSRAWNARLVVNSSAFFLPVSDFYLALFEDSRPEISRLGSSSSEYQLARVGLKLRRHFLGPVRAVALQPWIMGHSDFGGVISGNESMEGDQAKCGKVKITLLRNK
jgi:hypothetical protein